MRCDLHVHTSYSGPVDIPGLRHLSRECYSAPLQVYETAKRRGMDLVTITDHDSIEGALELIDRPDFFIGEEVTCEIGSGREIHLGVWDIDERLHEGIARRRTDFEALLAWLGENDVPACINHPFSPLTGPRDPGDLHLAFGGQLLMEVQNGMMPAETNEFARRAANERHLGQVAGSDSHTLRGVGSSFTTVPRARSRTEFLSGLREGFTVPTGKAGSYGRLTADVLTIFGNALHENTELAFRDGHPRVRMLAGWPALPLSVLIPFVTLGSYARELLGGRRIHAAFQQSLTQPEDTGPRPRLGMPLATVTEQ